MITNFKYLIPNDKDKSFGLTVNTVGFQTILPAGTYPIPNHPSGYYFNPKKGRILSEYQILCISKGSGIFQSETTEKTQVNKGQVIILFPGQWHTYRPLTETGWNEYYIGFEGSIIDNMVKQNFISPTEQILDIGFNEELINLFSTAIKVAKDERRATQQCLSGIIMNILGLVFYLSQNLNSESERTRQIVERAKIAMSENIDKNIDIKLLAEDLGISYSLFRRTFKEYTGYPPSKYFQEIKLRKAKQLLLETDMSIKEISFELDFNSYEYFLATFKKKTGLTPFTYRNKLRKKG